MKFIDLFAGLGGFHVGLKKLGFECVFASEINTHLRELYKENFKIDCKGDINLIDKKDIPKHDILCAGFPCQPFSKAGKQEGLADIGRGDMIYKIAEILNYHQPSYFILENVARLKTHNQGETWKVIKRLLIQANYNIDDIILSPHHFGIPHKRERIFIVGQHKRVKKPINLPVIYKTNKQDINIKDYLQECKESQKISPEQIKCLKIWQNFISSLPKENPLPKFPIWSMEFGANYPLNTTPYSMNQKQLEKYKGVFGQSLKGLNKEEQLKRLPVYAIYPQKQFPDWKVKYISKNREFWQENKNYLQGFLPKIKTFVNSWQKLEWNCGEEGKRDIFEYILQFRSSGIRVKSLSSVPSLVLTNTQTPIIAWKKRYLNINEAQKLQGFENIKMPEERGQTFRALGNAVNSFVVEKLAQEVLKNKLNRIKSVKISNKKMISKQAVCV